MESLIVAGILLIIVGAAVLYLQKEKKKGVRCIGCPAAGHCAAKGCGEKEETFLKGKNLFLYSKD